MKKVSKVLEPIGVPFDSNIKFFEREYTDEQPLLFIPGDKSYFEVLGYRVETGKELKTMEDITNWLKHIKEVEIENEQLKKHMSEFGEYILTKYEEAKLDAQYIDGTRIPNVQERVYEDILNRMELN